MKRLLIICLFFLAACSSNYDGKYSKDGFGIAKAPAVYTVKKGDTLFSIAWRFGLEPAVIRRKNGISDPNKIFVGQKLRLTSRQASSQKTTRSNTPVKPIANWVWPLRGDIVKHFHRGQIGANGIRIAGTPNQTVNAAAGGVVAYQGNGLNGYGNVLIIKHKNGLLSAYGFLSKTYVKEGQKIKKRQRIGVVGYAANRQLMLHFEVRKNGKPVNPKLYIGNQYRF
ncbi:MAG: peptidase M23 [Gammaproteobacteria bacterium]|nr:MAG: peptidase M23 [Gammaproteobacteria bacterium]